MKREANKFNVSISDMVNLHKLFIEYIGIYGIDAMEQALNILVLRQYKKDNRYAGRFLINKVCEEFEISSLELFESAGKQELVDARTVYCAIAYDTFDLSQDQIGSGFGRKRGLVYRATKEISDAATQPKPSPYQKKLLSVYNRLKFRMNAYMAFQAKKREVKDNTDAPE